MVKELGGASLKFITPIIQLGELRKKQEKSVGRIEEWMMSAATSYLETDTLTEKK